MEIKEIEKLLSVSRSNIRFYEKQGLLTPERQENNYRDYSEQDVAMIKKIIVLRKLGLSVEEIAAMQKGELSLPDAINENVARLEKEIEKLKGALETSKTLSEEQTTFEELDQERYWNVISHAENEGKDFFDICKDYLFFEVDVFDAICRTVLFFNFKKLRREIGVIKACGVILIFCVAKGIVSLFKEGDFWQGFLYFPMIFIALSVLILPIYILARKAPKVAGVVVSVLVILIIAFFALLALLILYGIVSSFFR